MYPKRIGRRLQSNQPIKQSNVVGICSFLSLEKAGSRYEMLNIKGCDKKYMCGEHLMADSEEYPYDLPENHKVKHWKCLCPRHYQLYNNAFEKFFFNFDNTGHFSRQYTSMSSPSGKNNTVSDF